MHQQSLLHRVYIAWFPGGLPFTYKFNLVGRSSLRLKMHQWTTAWTGDTQVPPAWWNLGERISSSSHHSIVTLLVQGALKTSKCFFLSSWHKCQIVSNCLTMLDPVPQSVKQLSRTAAVWHHVKEIDRNCSTLCQAAKLLGTNQKIRAQADCYRAKASVSQPLPFQGVVINSKLVLIWQAISFCF